MILTLQADGGKISIPGKYITVCAEHIEPGKLNIADNGSAEREFTKSGCVVGVLAVAMQHMKLCSLVVVESLEYVEYWRLMETGERVSYELAKLIEIKPQSEQEAEARASRTYVHNADSVKPTCDDCGKTDVALFEYTDGIFCLRCGVAKKRIPR